MDVNEGVLPGAQGQDMMLPQKLRRQLGMETYRDREKLTEHYFRILLQGRKKFISSFRSPVQVKKSGAASYKKCSGALNGNRKN